MKIVVVGGSGLIGSKLVARLGEHGHEAVPASPRSGVDTITGEGVAEVLVGADVVVDVSNSPSFADADVLAFFETSTTNLLAAAADAGVGHCVALSVVGTERLPDSGYLRAKVAQEELIKKSGIPYSLVRATQFFEFVSAIADAATSDGVAVGAPLNGFVEVGGPEEIGMDELLRRNLAARDDSRTVRSDPHAHYFGTELAERSLVPGAGAIIAETSYADWLARSR